MRPAEQSESGRALLAWVQRTTAPDGPRAVRWMDQAHGSKALLALGPAPGDPVDEPRLACAGSGDALVSGDPDLAVVALTADCASIALGSPEGVFAAVHAGWRGLVTGIVPAALEAMRVSGATEIAGALGPCVHAECYEFSERDLAPLVEAYGARVRAETADGRPALDLPAAVAAALEAGGVSQVAGPDVCTACGPGYFSHRARGDGGRQALVVWRSGTGWP